MKKLLLILLCLLTSFALSGQEVPDSPDNPEIPEVPESTEFPDTPDAPPAPDGPEDPGDTGTQEPPPPPEPPQDPENGGTPGGPEAPAADESGGETEPAGDEAVGREGSTETPQEPDKPGEHEESLLGGDDGPLSIAWEPVAGAAAYRVEIRREGVVFIDTETDATKLRLDLAPGEYEYRIRVLDPFGNEAATTDWTYLKVQRARTPYFRVTRPVEVWEGKETCRLDLEIIGINDSLEFVLRHGDVELPLERSTDETGDSVSVDTTGLEPGEWDLHAVARSGLTFTHPGALVIRPTRPPEVTGLDTSEAFAEGLVPIAFDGLSFDEEMTVSFKGPEGYAEVAAVEVSDGSRATAYLNLEGAAPGVYDLIATNPAGEETVVEGALTVTAPEEEKKPKVQPRFEFHLGWAPMVVIGDIPDNGEIYGLATFEAALTFHSGWTAPFINGLGIETRVLFGGALVLSNSATMFDYMVKADLAGYWRPPVRGKAAPVILLGFGNMWSGFAESYGLKNMLFLRFGLGVDFSTYTRFTRIGLNAELAFTSDEPLLMVSLMFRRGFRF